MIERTELNGDIKYRLNGQLHKPNGPAWTWGDDKWCWYLYGNFHRYYGPRHHHGSGEWWAIHGETIK